MKYIKLYEGFKKKRKKGKKKKKLHCLSGIALIVENRILMVNAQKHSGYVDKWSLPKGHIENGDSLSSALQELREESGIILDQNYDEVFQYSYRKSGFNKLMDVYVYRRSRSEVEKYLDGWDISRDYLDEEEIAEASFLTAEQATDYIDISMVDLLDLIVI